MTNDRDSLGDKRKAKRKRTTKNQQRVTNNCFLATDGYQWTQMAVAEDVGFWLIRTITVPGKLRSPRVLRQPRPSSKLDRQGFLRPF